MSTIPIDLPSDPEAAYRMGRKRGRELEKQLYETNQKTQIELNRKQLHVAVRQVLFNEIFPAAKDGGKGATGATDTWRDWIKQEIRDAVLGWTRGHDVQGQVREMMLHEIRQGVRDLGWAGNSGAVSRLIREEAQKEAQRIARKMIQDSFAIDITLSGSVTQPAKGQRVLDLSDTAEGDHDA